MSNEGKKVKVHYVGTLDDGTKFDSSFDRNEPLEFTCGAGQMIPGFDEAVKNMEVGQTVKAHIPAALAYGERREDMVQKVPLDQIPNGDQLPVGQTHHQALVSGQFLLQILHGRHRHAFAQAEERRAHRLRQLFQEGSRRFRPAYLQHGHTLPRPA